MDMTHWNIALSRDWDVLGPFPIHAREQYFLSPAFPLQLSAPYTHDHNKKYSSAYADGAEVMWERCHSNEDGDLDISFPKIRWADIRLSVGWAGLQYHSVLHTSLIVTPPHTIIGTTSPAKIPRLLVNLRRGTYFSVLPRLLTNHSAAPEWHAGNIYALVHAGPSSVELPGIFNDGKPRIYDFFVSVDYEFRLFGDPREAGTEVPTLQMNIQVALEEKVNKIVRSISHDVLCDIVDGFAFGDALGIGLRSVDGWWKVEGVDVPSGPPYLSLSLEEKQIVGPAQTRIVPISVSQSSPITDGTLRLALTVRELRSDNGGNLIVLPVTLILKRLSLFGVPLHRAIRASCFFAKTHATLFLVKPPTSLDFRLLQPPILALHGSGVDIVLTTFWEEAIPARKHSWVIFPIGRTEWGLDWHGPSSSEAWAAVLAFHRILHSRGLSLKEPLVKNLGVAVVGHSNGGQGAWHFAAHWPDRVHGAVAAAGFLNAQLYVPRTMSVGARFADPTLRAVLDSALTPDNNELFLANIAGNVPVLSIHGGNDANVPTWHSREYVHIIRSWNENADVIYHEDLGKPHWYPEVFYGNHVQSFLDRVLGHAASSDAIPLSQRGSTYFTLTVVDPASSGSLHGWIIDALCVPGRLSRLQVNISEQTHVRTSNVLRFSLRPGAAGYKGPFIVDDMSVSGTASHGNGVWPRRFVLSDHGIWECTPAVHRAPPPGRALNILSTRGPLTLVVPSANTPAGMQARSAAHRLAHSLDVFVKLDTRIISDIGAVRSLSSLNAQAASCTSDIDVVSNDMHTGTEEADVLSITELLAGNVIIIGGTENRLTRTLLQSPEKPRTDFALSADGRQWLFRGLPLSHLLSHPHERIGKFPGHAGDEDLALLFTHPHPWSSDSGAALFLIGTGSTDTRNSRTGDGLERALRLFMPRTGVSVPDWMIAGPSMDFLGAGGILGTGVWNNEWRWSEPMSWMV